jgi:hypothetical protein
MKKVDERLRAHGDILSSTEYELGEKSNRKTGYHYLTNNGSTLEVLAMSSPCEASWVGEDMSLNWELLEVALLGLYPSGLPTPMDMVRVVDDTQLEVLVSKILEYMRLYNMI